MTEALIEESKSVHRSTIIIDSERCFEFPLQLPVSFKSNKISTSKYNFLTFIPKNLWSQFHKLANVYFLVIAVLQCIPDISVSGGIPDILLPLALVLAASAFKDLLEDNKRKKSDREENNRRVLKRSYSWLEIPWKNVSVGDFLKVRKDEYFPADLVLLSSSEPKGMCYVETKNLDGETNLKYKLSPNQTVGISENDLDTCRGTLRCEDANPMIYEFSGVLHFNETSFPVSYEQFLLRGSSLKNTDWVIGLVVYTGHESKIMLNSSRSIIKFSKMEGQMNLQIIMIFITQICLCVFCAAFYAFYQIPNHKFSYVELDKSSNDSAVTQFILMFFTWMLIFTNFVPISLLVTLDLVKFFQAIFIELDIAMYYEPIDMPAEVHTSNLNEELGQISHLFSDKTGTLTCNVMEFRKVSIMGTAFGTNEHIPQDEKIPNVDFVDPTFDASRPESVEFFLSLAICHTIIADGDEYKASSPDELALVRGAQFFDIKFVGRDLEHNIIIQHGQRQITATLLNVIEFSSDRKRMSVIVRYFDGSIRLICKGADNVLLPRLSPSMVISPTVEHLEEFGKEGLRTLLITYKEINPIVYRRWNQRYEAAMNDIYSKDRRIFALGEEIEQDLILLGATAIEDKLQDGVPETIYNLRKTGIKLWVLTGDKKETAVNIGFACNLLTNEMTRLEVTASRTLEVEEEIKLAKLTIKTMRKNTFALVISGESLIKFRNKAVEDDFVWISEWSKAVIACRMSPNQKAYLVNLIKTRKPSIRTLSIGDGANDVNMILAAHVGVGIAGLEGKQAARASDYTIAQFSYLQRLLFIHGRECYRKNATLICYNFYKNVLLVMPLFFYGIFSAFSGQPLYNPWVYEIYNVIYVSLPITLYAIFDKEMPLEELLNETKHYAIGLKSKLFSAWMFWKWLLKAVIQAFIICIVSTCCICGFYDGKTNNSMSIASLVIFGMVVIAANLMVYFISYTHYWFTLLFLFLSTANYFISIYFIMDIFPASFYLENYNGKGGFSQMVSSWNYYAASILILVTCFFIQPIIREIQAFFRNDTEEFPSMITSLNSLNSQERESSIKSQEEQALRARRSMRQFSTMRNSYLDTGFAYSEEPGQNPQVTDPDFLLRTEF